MNFRDRSPNRLGQTGPMERNAGRFRQDFRPGFGRGRMNDTRNVDDRPRFDNRNTGGFDNRNSGGFDNRNAGGFDNRNSGGFDNRNSGGFDNRNSGGFDNRNSGGFDNRNTGGFDRNTSGFDNRNSSGFNHRNAGGFDNRNSSGFRSGPPVSNLSDSRGLSKDITRDFGPRIPDRDNSSRPGEVNIRDPPIETNKRIEPAKPTPPITPAAAPVSTPNIARTNDVEIIVTHKSLTEYAEFIERRLKTVGLSVDLLFPNEEVPLGRVLANIASRGTLFALVVTQLSEEHRSVTVNILHGQTQEHRNMPLDDAIPMIVKNFEAYVKGERGSVVPPVGAVPITAAGFPLGEKHPELIQTLLNIVVENRTLTVLQYDKIINYLQEKKEKQVKLELGSEVPAKIDIPPQNTKTDLENRILNILSDKPPVLLPPTQQPNPSLIKDTSTLKALQNIVQNNLLTHNSTGTFGNPLGPRV